MDVSPAAKPWIPLVSDPKHGPLPSLLLVLTLVSGLVDAVSILALGRVFVANMTGNVAFIGFAIAGARGFSLSASLFALGGFIVGAFAGGLVIGHTGPNRGKLLRDAALLELALLGLGVVVAHTSAVPFKAASRDTIAAVTAVAMGVQNAAARRLAVPDLTTTVLTMTLTGLASEYHQRHVVLARRLLATLMILGGAGVGAVLVDHVQASAPLDVALGLVAVVIVATVLLTRRHAAWQGA